MAGKVGGRIVRIKLKGFMTYDELEIIPVKGLNLILGLNGSGKSSIMCAICLGLGGKPQYTGRAVSLSDFIKYNHTKAMVEIELESTHGRNDVISRVIHSDKQLWYLNNKLVNHAEITALIKRYNIDMGNLCQFLPQEKVAEFSKMDKKQRLVNMIQAIGDPKLVTLFDELKALRNNYVRFGKDLEELESHKVSEEKCNERLKPEIEKQEERMQLEHDLKLYKLQKMGFEYEHLKTQVNRKDDEIKEQNREILQIEKEYDKLRAEKTTHTVGLRDYQTKLNQLKGDIHKYMQNLNKCSESLRACHEEVDNAKIYFRNRMEAKEDQSRQLDTLSKQINHLKEVLMQKKEVMANLKQKLMQNGNDYEIIKQQLSACDSNIETVNLNKRALEYKKRSKEEEIYKISNEENKKYEVLRQKYSDTYTALQWLRQNESSFKSRISYPPLVSIKVENDECRKFIENTVAVRDLLMFVCEDKDDLERFVNIMKHEKKLSVNASMVPDESLADFHSQPITDSMRNLGIHCYLKDLFTAPELVMRYLCKINRVHLVPVCNEKAEENINSILRYSTLFFTVSERISGKKSRYGQQSMSVRRDDLVSYNVLPNIKDNSTALLYAKNELQEIENALVGYRPQFEELERQRTQLERQQEQLRKEKNEINSEIRKLNELRLKLAQFSDNYERKAKDIINEEEEKKKVTDAIQNLNAKKLENLTEMHKITKGILKSKKEKAISILLIKCLNEKFSALEENISNVGANLNNKKSDLSRLLQEKNRLRTEAKNHLRLINEADISEEDHEKLSVVFTNQLHKIEEVDRQISYIEAKLELTNEDIAPIMAEYKRREQAIQSLGEQVETIKIKIDDLKSRIQEKKVNWLEPLLIHIESVNKKFSQYYKILKCAGEISLDQTDDPDDFPNYGLQIKLKYRVDEEFMELSQTHHSGGECSVAAIIFILSLQELTDVPFRCIDEINQGMDAINERKMYQLVADAARSGSCSQYFLLTPKLLMDLSYHKDVAVHTIFNSPFLQAKLDVKEHLKIAKSLKQ